MENPGQFLGIDLEHDAEGDGRAPGCAEPVWTRHALLTEEVSRSEQRHCGFFAALGNSREFSPAHPKIKKAVGAVSLRREDLFRLDADDGSSRASSREVCIRIEGSRAFWRHNQSLQWERKL